MQTQGAFEIFYKNMVILVSKPITSVSLWEPDHSFRRQWKNPLVDNRIHKRLDAFQRKFTPLPLPPRTT